MLRLITISSLICLTLVGSANAEQPIALKLKLKVEGDIERVDTGVWAQCFIEQVVVSGWYHPTKFVILNYSFSFTSTKI